MNQFCAKVTAGSFATVTNWNQFLAIFLQGLRCKGNIIL